MKRVKSLAESRLLTKNVSEAIGDEAKEQKSGIFSMLSGTLADNAIGNMLDGKFKIARQGIIRAGVGTIGAGQCF